ncbi:MAG: hypothetical protein AAB316_25120 [Bacteroidota bacterium]
MSNSAAISQEKDQHPVMVQYRWYRQHQDELVKRYNGRILVIADQKIIGDYSSRDEAFRQAMKSYNPGTFMVRHCMPREEERIIHWNTRQITTF